MIDFNTFTKIAKNAGYVDKSTAVKGFEKLPKVQYIAQSGHIAKCLRVRCTESSKKTIPNEPKRILVLEFCTLLFLL